MKKKGQIIKCSSSGFQVFKTSLLLSILIIIATDQEVTLKNFTQQLIVQDQEKKFVMQIDVRFKISKELFL
jgi:DNA-directed RNA polymerase subunit E'/Rpb7